MRSKRSPISNSFPRVTLSPRSRWARFLAGLTLSSQLACASTPAIWRAPSSLSSGPGCPKSFDFPGDLSKGQSSEDFETVEASFSDAAPVLGNAKYPFGGRELGSGLGVKRAPLWLLSLPYWVSIRPHLNLDYVKDQKERFLHSLQTDPSREPSMRPEELSQPETILGLVQATREFYGRDLPALEEIPTRGTPAQKRRLKMILSRFELSEGLTSEDYAELASQLLQLKLPSYGKLPPWLAARLRAFAPESAATVMHEYVESLLLGADIETAAREMGLYRDSGATKAERLRKWRAEHPNTETFVRSAAINLLAFWKLGVPISAPRLRPSGLRRPTPQELPRLHQLAAEGRYREIYDELGGSGLQKDPRVISGFNNAGKVATVLLSAYFVYLILQQIHAVSADKVSSQTPGDVEADQAREALKRALGEYSGESYTLMLFAQFIEGFYSIQRRFPDLANSGDYEQVKAMIVDAVLAGEELESQRRQAEAELGGAASARTGVTELELQQWLGRFREMLEAAKRSERKLNIK